MSLRPNAIANNTSLLAATSIGAKGASLAGPQTNATSPFESRVPAVIVHAVESNTILPTSNTGLSGTLSFNISKTSDYAWSMVLCVAAPGLAYQTNVADGSTTVTYNLLNLSNLEITADLHELQASYIKYAPLLCFTNAQLTVGQARIDEISGHASVFMSEAILTNDSQDSVGLLALDDRNARAARSATPQLWTAPLYFTSFLNQSALKLSSILFQAVTVTVDMIPNATDLIETPTSSIASTYYWDPSGLLQVTESDSRRIAAGSEPTLSKWDATTSFVTYLACKFAYLKQSDHQGATRPKATVITSKLSERLARITTTGENNNCTGITTSGSSTATGSTTLGPIQITNRGFTSAIAIMMMPVVKHPSTNAELVAGVTNKYGQLVPTTIFDGTSAVAKYAVSPFARIDLTISSNTLLSMQAQVLNSLWASATGRAIQSPNLVAVPLAASWPYQRGLFSVYTGGINVVRMGENLSITVSFKTEGLKPAVDYDIFIITSHLNIGVYYSGVLGLAFS